jgi:hypothetical protein
MRAARHLRAHGALEPRLDSPRPRLATGDPQLKWKFPAVRLVLVTLSSVTVSLVLNSEHRIPPLPGDRRSTLGGLLNVPADLPRCRSPLVDG